MNSKTGLMPLSIIVVLGLAGCVTDDQLAPVRTFSTAATSFASQADGALTQLNESYVVRNMTKVASGDGLVTDATFQGVLDNDTGFIASQNALKAIGVYAAALSSLATANYQGAIDTAATDLYGSLQSIDKDAATLLPGAPALSDAELGIVATAIKGVGEVIADEKRLEAIKKAVHAANPGIQAICKGFLTTLDGVRSTYHKNLDVIYTSEFEAYKNEAGSLSYDVRITRLNELRSAKQAITSADAFLAKLSDSAALLAKSHAEFDAALQNSKWNYSSLMREVGQLKSLADDLKTFNAGLKKTNP